MGAIDGGMGVAVGVAVGVKVMVGVQVWPAESMQGVSVGAGAGFVELLLAGQPCRRRGDTRTARMRRRFFTGKSTPLEVAAQLV